MRRQLARRGSFWRRASRLETGAARQNHSFPPREGAVWGRHGSVNVRLRPPSIFMWSRWLLTTRTCIYRERRGTRTCGPGEKTQGGRTEVLYRQPAWLLPITIHTQNVMAHSPKAGTSNSRVRPCPCGCCHGWMKSRAVSLHLPFRSQGSMADPSYLFHRVAS